MGRLSNADSNLNPPRKVWLNADHDAESILSSDSHEAEAEAEVGDEDEENLHFELPEEEEEYKFQPTMILPLRDNYTGPEFPMKTFDGPKAQLHDTARLQMVFDYQWLYEQDQHDQLEQVEQRRKRIKCALKLSQSKFLKSVKEFTSSPPKHVKLKELQQRVADHYEVNIRTLQRILKRHAELPSVAKLKSPGRKPIQTAAVRKVVRQTLNKTKGAPLRKLAKKLAGRVDWQSTYKGNIRSSPSPWTLGHMKKKHFKPHMVRKRPFLSAKAIQERQDFAPAALAWTLPFECRDEAYIEVKSSADSCYYLSIAPDEQEEVNENDVVVKDNGGDKHNPKVFLMGSVTMPGYTLNAEGKVESFDPVKNGKILLARVRGFHKRKRGEYKPGTKEYVEGKKPGDPIFTNTTINSQRYFQLHFMPGGLVDSINLYNNPALRPEGYKTAKVLALDENAPDKLSAAETAELKQPFNEVDYPGTFICQEDGAPGHGYNNLQGGKANNFHDMLARRLLKEKRIKLVKQSRHSPEFNALDLGVWSIIKAEVDARCDEIPAFTGQGGNSDEVEAKIWEIVKVVWENKVTPRLLFNIFKQREAMLHESIRLNGESIVKEPHTGIRMKYGTGSPKGNQAVAPGFGTLLTMDYEEEVEDHDLSSYPLYT